MYQPQIIDEVREGFTARLRLRVPSSLAYFKDHFPSWPILPGVVQLHWAIGFVQRLFNERGEFQRVENLKFQRIVAPDTELKLTLAYDEQKKRFEFSYDNGGTVCSSGRLIFKETL